MHEVARVTLENEMDLILAHKRAMKLAELAGLSLPSQTTFATAVSEVSRYIIEDGKSGCLILSIDVALHDKYLVACLKDEQSDNIKSRGGLENAKKLVNKYNISIDGANTLIELFYLIPPAFKIGYNKLDEWRNIFRKDPPISPYEELKRKNEQLQELSEKIQKSEARYKTLTNSLPLIIFSLDHEGQILYANEWLLKYTGQTPENINNSYWKTIVHPDDYDSFKLLLQNDITRDAATIKIQCRIKNGASDEYLWHQISLSPLQDEKKEDTFRIGYIVDIHSQKMYEETLKDNAELKHIQNQLNNNQQILEKSIDELNKSNHELKQFAFVASHDLQEPVRKLLFYSDYLLNKYLDSFDSKGAGFLANIQAASQQMRNLIQGLLLFSQINKSTIKETTVSLDKIAKEVCGNLDQAIKDKQAIIHIEPLPAINGDTWMLKQLFENIILNALKHAKPSLPPVINISCDQGQQTSVIVFKDNGLGFNEKYLQQMFSLFKKIHSGSSDDGTGLGLAICRKIVTLHNGKIWAKGKEGEGATFFVSFPNE